MLYLDVRPLFRLYIGEVGWADVYSKAVSQEWHKWYRMIKCFDFTSFSRALSLWSKSLLSVMCLSTPSTLKNDTFTSVWWSQIRITTFYCHSVGAGMWAHLEDIRLSLSVSLLFWILFWAVRKSSFWMVSHVMSLLAAFPLNCNTNREGKVFYHCYQSTQAWSFLN